MDKEATVKSHLRKLAFEKECNISKIARKTGISRTTITALYHQKSTFVSFAVLEKLCRFFNCGVGDLLILSAVELKDNRIGKEAPK